MDNKIQIAAVIPTFNREKTLPRAINSVLAQEFPASEVIIVDDGSDDGTRRIVESFGAKCRYFYQENGGVSAARNRGVGEAACDWIAFLDSDDSWVPRHLVRMAEAIEATNGEASLYFCDAMLPSEAGGLSYWVSTGFKIDAPFLLKRDASAWVLMAIQPIVLQASVIKRSSYWDVGGLPRGLRTREDTLLLFKLGLRYPACAVSGCGTMMTMDGGMCLSEEMGSRDYPYWQATLTVYREMLSFAATSRPEFRRRFLDGMSAANFSLGRLFFRDRKLFQSAKTLMLSAGTSPRTFLRCLSESLGFVRKLR